jgi:hypothetical protein
MRDKKMKYREIAERLGVTTRRAWTMAQYAEEFAKFGKVTR